MVRVELAAYPLLLATSYVVYRLGQRADARSSTGFAASRFLFQACVMGVISGVNERLVSAGAILLPWGLAAPALAVGGILGLVAIDGHTFYRSTRMPKAVPVVGEVAVSVKVR